MSCGDGRSLFPRIDCNLFTFSISEYIFILTAVIDIQNRDIGIFPPCPDFYQGCFFYFAERFFLLISTIIVAIPPPLMSKAIIHGQTFALSPVFGLVLESELPFPLLFEADEVPVSVRVFTARRKRRQADFATTRNARCSLSASTQKGSQRRLTQGKCRFPCCGVSR
jgi:hypothetical protein